MAIAPNPCVAFGRDDDLLTPAPYSASPLEYENVGYRNEARKKKIREWRFAVFIGKPIGLRQIFKARIAPRSP